MRRAGDIDGFQRLIAADAVIGMDDEITLRQVVYLGDELVEVTSASRDSCQTVAQNVLLAEQHELSGCEALLDRQYRESDRREGQLCEGIAVGDAPQVG